MTSNSFQTSVQSVRRVLAVVAVIGMLLAGLGREPAFAQDEVANSPSPAEEQSRVIAQSVATLPSSDVVWRVTVETAPAAADASFSSQSLSFILADHDAILIQDESTGALTRIAKGEAAFIAPDSNAEFISLGKAETTFIRIALIPTDQADDTDGGAEIIYTGTSFAAPEGARDIDLISSDLGTGSINVVSPNAPALVFSTRGVVAVRFKSKSTPLKSGEAGSFGPGTPQIIDDGDIEGSFIAAVIGPAIPDFGQIIAPAEPTAETEPTAEGGTASVTVDATTCPEGHTFSEQLEGPDQECVDPGSDLYFSLTNNDTGDYLDGTTDSDGQLVFGDLAPGSYQLAPSIDGADVHSVCGSSVSGLMGSGDLLQISDGEAVECNMNVNFSVIETTSAAGNGEIDFTALSCPEDYEFPGDLSGPDPNCGSPLPDVYIYLEQLDDGSATANGYTANSGMIRFIDMPAGTYSFTASPPSDTSPAFGIVCVGPNGSTGDIVVLDPDTRVDCYIHVSEYSS